MRSPANRQDEILAAAARIFQRKGYHGTSVRDIADAVGLLKGSLYHYISSKEELLVRLFEGLLEDTVAELEAIAGHDVGPADRLRDMVRAYARAIIANQGAVGLYLRDWRSLPVRELAGVAARRRRMRALFSGVIAEGARAGDLVPGDPNVAALAILGMCNWMYEWYRPDGRLTREAVIDELAERAVRSVRP
jgi:TetR/AcrR family transcriptional regulator, cholesterol catabolism regulator